MFRSLHQSKHNLMMSDAHTNRTSRTFFRKHCVNKLQIAHDKGHQRQQMPTPNDGCEQWAASKLPSTFICFWRFTTWWVQVVLCVFVRSCSCCGSAIQSHSMYGKRQYWKLLYFVCILCVHRHILCVQFDLVSNLLKRDAVQIQFDPKFNEMIRMTSWASSIVIIFAICLFVCLFSCWHFQSHFEIF